MFYDPLHPLGYGVILTNIILEGNIPESIRQVSQLKIVITQEKFVEI